MFDVIDNILQYPFITRALIVGVFVSFCAALLGVSLVLKRYSMIGDGLSHVGFSALSIAVAMNWAPMIISIPVIILTAILLLHFSEKNKISGDAAIALISTSSLALGIIAVSITSGINIDVFNYMFGSILAISQSDLTLSIIISTIVLILFIMSYNKIFAITFDENFSYAIGINVKLYKMLLAVLTGIMIVVGMKIMGALLMSSLIIFPTLSSTRVCKRFKSVAINSAIISIVSFIVGLAFSYFCSTPTGATVVAIDLIIFIVYSLIGIFKQKI